MGIYPSMDIKHALPPAKLTMKSAEQQAQERKPLLQEYLDELASVKLLWPCIGQFLGVPLSTLDPDAHALDKKMFDKSLEATKGGKKGNDSGSNKRAAKEREEFMRKNQEAIQKILAGENFELPKKRANWTQRIQNRKHYWESKKNLNINIGQNYAQGDDNLYIVNISWEPDEDEPHCIPIVADEVIEILVKKNEDWWWALKKDSKEGYVPAACLVENPKSHMLGGNNKPPVSDPRFTDGIANELSIEFDTMKKIMNDGQTVTKYASGMGQPTQKDLFWRKFADSDSNIGCLFYSQVGNRDQNPKRMICLRLITDIYVGKQTAAFKRKCAHDAKVNFCFSICTSDGGNFNFATDDQDKRDNWLWMVYLLRDSENYTPPLIHHQADLSEIKEDQAPTATKQTRSVSKMFSNALTDGVDSLVALGKKDVNDF